MPDTDTTSKPVNQFPITRQHLGCWIDGSYGWRGTGMVVTHAIRHGHQVPEDELEALRRFNNGDTDDPDLLDLIVVMSDDAETYLNTIAPRGTYFEWHDGEFFLTAEECEGHESTDGPIGNVTFCDGTCLA